VSYFAVIYRYCDDAAKLEQNRPAHRAWLGQMFDQGRLKLAGPLTGAAPRAGLLLVEATDLAEAEAMVDQDPVCRDGLVASRD